MRIEDAEEVNNNWGVGILPAIPREVGYRFDWMWEEQKLLWDNICVTREQARIRVLEMRFGGRDVVEDASVEPEGVASAREVVVVGGVPDEVDRPVHLASLARVVDGTGASDSELSSTSSDSSVLFLGTSMEV